MLQPSEAQSARRQLDSRHQSSLLYPIIDRMLGGSVSADSALKRPLSEIELRLANRVTNVVLRELQNAWANVVTLKMEVERVESNPQLVQIVPPNEVVIMVSFEMVMGNLRGMTNLCIPFNTIERVGSKLTSNSWIGYASSRKSEASKKQITEQLDGALAEVIVTLANSTIKTKDLFDLQVGDIISTEKAVQSPIEVEVTNVVKFLASLGSFKGRKAIKIEDCLEDNPKYTRKD